ncbi:MAG TPA: HAMP domain-containing sensor histidine kinase [Chloroflexota bacterium]|nr:HAMP domain-containing sensor histidine kinase [Chloroflexota bacterium]
MSLRFGLVIAFTGIILFSMVTAGLALMFLLRGYQDGLTETRMRDLSRPLFVRVALAGEEFPRGLPTPRVREALRARAGDLAVVGLIVDDDGKVHMDTSPNRVFIGQQLPLVWPESGPGRTAEPGDESGGREGQSPAKVRPAYDVDGDRGPHQKMVSGIFRGLDGNRYVYASSKLPMTVEGTSRTFNLVLATPSVDITQGLGNLAQVLSAAGAVALAGAVILAVVIARRLARPLQYLKMSAREVAAGNYDRQAPVEGAREIQSLARSFNQMTRRVRNARQQQRTFLANVSHELRTPLTSIQGFSQAIIEGAVTDREGYRRAAGIINDGAQRLIRLVEQLLDLDRIESRTTEMVLEDVDLADLVERVVSIFEIRSEEAGVDIVRRLGPIPTVLGDSDRLEQVLTNLVDNAIRHSPSGGKVTIGLAADGPTGVVLTVDDEGLGISPPDAEKVFERFQTEPDGSGIGLGLAIAREIVRVHGGELRSENRDGGGARLVITLGTSSAAAGSETADPA